MWGRFKKIFKKTPAAVPPSVASPPVASPPVAPSPPPPPPPPARTPTDESKEQTISTLAEPHMMPTLLTRQQSLDSDAYMQGYDEREKSFEYLRKTLTPSMFHYYMNLLNVLPYDYKQSLAKPSSQRIKQDNQLIHSIFDMIEPIDTPLLVYRCYQNGVNFKTLKSQRSNTVLSSTTLSFIYANRWCSNIIQPGVVYDYQRREKSNFMICILILPGTKIIPLIADYLENKRFQYEILLDSRSTLHFTGEIKQPQGIPIFVNLPGNDISVNNAIYERNKIMVQQIIEKETTDKLDKIYRDPKRSDDVDHFMKWQDTDMEGGKSRKFKKPRKTRKFKKSKKSRKSKKTRKNY